MHSLFRDKTKESATSVLPVMALVTVIFLLLKFSANPLSVGEWTRFVFGGVLLIVGLAIFLIGADIGMVPFGQKLGSALTHRRNLPLILISAFIIGFAIAVAEPLIHALAGQVGAVAPDLNRGLMVVMVAVGVGFFLVVAMLRLYFRLSLRWLMTVFILLVFGMCAFIDAGFVGMAFDAGGATTGPIAVPFIMALGIGVSAGVKKHGPEDEEISFGYVGFAAIGPVAAVAVMGLFSDVRMDGASSAAPGAIVEEMSADPSAVRLVHDMTADPERLPAPDADAPEETVPAMSEGLEGAAAAPGGVLTRCAAGIQATLASWSPALGDFAAPFNDTWPRVVADIGMALAPLVVLFLIYQVTLLHLPTQQVKRMVMGLVYVFIGLVLFMVGVNAGFTPMGTALGRCLAEYGGWILIPVGLVLGAVVVCAEPSVWVLTEQVEEVSGGSIPPRVLLVSLMVSVALAVALGMTRVVTGLSIWYILFPGYLAALALTRKCPPLFTAIAFDSGSVASGPMSTTFVLALAIGAAAAIPGRDPVTDAFGMVALIAMAPIVTIQLLGMVYQHIGNRRAAALDARKPHAEGGGDVRSDV